MNASPPPDPGPGPNATLGPRCQDLRHSGMYVHTDADPDQPRGGDGTSYWCLKTHKGFGPDDALVDGADCRDPRRSCYEAS